METITILGATGSIGMSTLDVIAKNKEDYAIYALTGHSQAERLFEQCVQFTPRYAVLTQELAVQRFRALSRERPITTELLVGEEALHHVVSDKKVDIVMAGIVGSAGLESTLSAVKAGKKVLLANKEALVMAGALVLSEVAKNQAQLIPVDSEHNAIFQCWPEGFLSGRLYPSMAINATPDAGVEKIILTASGGAFRDYPLEKMAHVTPEQACWHPNWVMGKKITVDSATMMNKALEVIEAHYLFGLVPDQIEVILHPESIVHSMVCYRDGSTLAQMGLHDMRIPIMHALAWPKRKASGVATLDLMRIKQLTFETLSQKRYPCLALAYQALQQGGLAATVLNAANEVAVARFLNHELGFTDIARLNEAMLAKRFSGDAFDLASIKAVDQMVRTYASQWR